MAVSRAVFDLEADNLLYGATRLWCCVAKDLDSGEVFKYPPNKIEEGLELLSSYGVIIGHNICTFDVPLIQKLYPGWEYKKLRDTLVMSKLFDPERRSGHSLESYGEQFNRAKPTHEDWTRFSEEMLYRCSEDVEINCMAYDYLVGRFGVGWNWFDSLNLEQEFALDQGLQELAGVDINHDLALRLVEEIDMEVATIDPILLGRMPKRVLPVGKPVNKVFLKDGSGYTAQVKKWINECT